MGEIVAKFGLDYRMTNLERTAAGDTARRPRRRRYDRFDHYV